MPSSHRSYSITQKLAILAEYEPGVARSGFRALAIKQNTNSSTVQGWWSQREELKAVFRNPQVATRTVRHLTGGGRRPAHNELERRLYEWIEARNRKGLRVKDSYIRLQARNIFQQLNGDARTGFEASSGWLARFKSRRNLVSRRQTTSRSSQKSGFSSTDDFTFVAG
ncbi:Tigger transposable element-derived protein 4 [Phytophthora citrophthora]|uniref:Tigger transposable element-derived protein 4 n=1 Tax=Phytophthora citrophthora TaxID=4793 RepID=A0AAD9LRJ5_9STRA|nr:Tigger transposable element-derived protein 4 [Phytophthora citrophthora]